jgi:hypothetical protein
MREPYRVRVFHAKLMTAEAHSSWSAKLQPQRQAFAAACLVASAWLSIGWSSLLKPFDPSSPQYLCFGLPGSTPLWSWAAALI